MENATKVSNQKAKEQFEVMREKQAQDRKEILGAQSKQEKLRLERGGTDFTLYNYILSTVDFSLTDDWAGALRLMYERLDIYLRDTVQEVDELRGIAGRYVEHFDDVDQKRFLELMKYPSNPNIKIGKLMKEIQDRANARSKLGMKAYEKTNIIS